ELGQAVTVNLSAAKVISMSKGMFGPFIPGQPNRAYDLLGIWQPVKLVVRGASRIDDVWFRPSLDSANVQVNLEKNNSDQARVTAVLTDRLTGQELAKESNEFAGSGKVGEVTTIRFLNL